MNNKIRTEVNMEEILAAGKEFFLSVGTPLQIEIEGVTVRLNSICVGWLRDHYLIIKQPSTGFGSIGSKLYNGNKITVRFINNGDIFAFQSEIMESSSSPRLIFVTYPKLVVRHSLRGSRRVICNLPAELTKDLNPTDIVPEVLCGIVSDVSVSGCGFEMTRSSSSYGLPDVTVDEPVNLRIRLPGFEQWMEFSGNVKRIQRDGKRLNLGIKFRDTDANTEDTITEYIQAVERFLQ
jgi:hypothetical protein